MFLINESNVYQITRESAVESFKKAIFEKFKSHYNDGFLEEVVQEIMQYVSFPDIMDSNEVYIHQNGKFSEYVLNNGIIATGKQYEIIQFSPSYSGPEVKEIDDIFKYPSLSQMVYEQTCYINAMIIQMGEEDYGIIQMSKDIKEDIAIALEEILSKSDSEALADAIVKKIYSESIVLVGLRQNNDMVYYSLELDDTCKKLNVFSANGLSQLIMSGLPNLQSVAKKVETVAIYLHNYILYNSEIRDFELKHPSGFEGKDAFFMQTVNGINFFLNLKSGLWKSKSIRANLSEIDWTKKDSRIEQDKYLKCNNTTTTYEGYYKGFKIVCPDFEEGFEPKINWILLSNYKEEFKSGDGKYHLIMHCATLYEYFVSNKYYEKTELDIRKRSLTPNCGKQVYLSVILA